MTGYGNSLPFWWQAWLMAIAFMALWLLCCVLLFITSRGYDWLSHQSWFLVPELSLPWLVLGGLGLALASNRDVWHWANQRFQSGKATPPTISPAISTSAPSSPSVVSEASQSSIWAAPDSPARPSSKETVSKTSISFKIAGSPSSSDT
ncbi:MAG: hypothetical protein F6K00_28580 [Leptolyngbya sp. SIOISBB]|nr:hypothetical protein [Leptolyngbya sp. SIOISBB]